MERLMEENEAAKWVYKLADIEIKIEIGGLVLKMPAKLKVTGAGQTKVFTGAASARTERQLQATVNKKELGVLTVDLRGGGGGG
jgi:hypothetical protein